MSNHVEQVSFRQCITFGEHRQLKGWRQPRVHNQGSFAKSINASTNDYELALDTSTELEAQVDLKILNLGT